MFLIFCVLDDFFRFSKKLGFWVFLVQPPMASVLLSASVERCFVSRMRDFCKTFQKMLQEMGKSIYFVFAQAKEKNKQKAIYFLVK